MSNIDGFPESPNWANVEEGAKQSFSDLQQRTLRFIQDVCPFPTQGNLTCHSANNLNQQLEVVDFSQQTYPLLHESCLPLFSAFLNLKREQGSEVEKDLYASMTVEDFIDRLLTKRPLAFLGRDDHYLLRDGVTRGVGGFEQIGTNKQSAPLELKNYLSYDEMQLSAMIAVSSPTHFINVGHRNNRAQVGEGGGRRYIPRGIYVGLVGARLEKPDYMEWKHLVVTPTQNTPENGYGAEAQKDPLLQLWAEFYGVDAFPSYEEVLQDKTGRYLEIGNGLFLDSKLYKKRMKVTLEAFLKEAESRAKMAGKPAYIHAVGIGLGEWRLAPCQSQLMLDVYAELLEEGAFNNISDLDLSWFPGKGLHCGGCGDGDYLGNTKIHFTKRSVAFPFEGDGEKLLVGSFAWDGNAFVGNEYWLGVQYLAASGDPAAVCCSTIGELQNPLINPYVSGPNTRIANGTGLFSLSD